MKSNQLTKASVTDLLKAYAEAASAHGAASAKGDYRKANPQHDTLAKIYRQLRSKGPEAQRSLLGLLDHPDDAIRGWAASHALDFAPDEGEPVLEALTTSSGVWKLIARMTLEKWRQGNLSFP
jgi:hypothetical protein